jgi:riboflavin kinase/FMN adenylyltransferase
VAKGEQQPPEEPAGAIAAIGAFDGVHRGHQRLLTDMVARAAALSAQPVCITFDPDPERVVRQDTAPLYLCSVADRVQLIEQLGVREVFIWPFTRAVASMTPDEFVASLCDRYALVEIWVGANFAFGRDRAGSVETLARLGERHGFLVHAAPLVCEGPQAISSSRIREMLRAGAVAEAGRLLGRPYHVGGSVIAGARRGRQLGFPTANLGVPVDRVLPAEGVYAGRARVGGQHHDAVANLGARPTFGEAQMLLEVHLLDFAGDVYDQHLDFDFVAHIRPTRRFSSLEELRAQIARDITDAREKLAPRTKPD